MYVGFSGLSDDAAYRSHPHRPWGCSEARAQALRAHLGQSVSNAHPVLELEFPARGSSPGQRVLWKQARQRPRCPLVPWATWAQEAAGGQVLRGSAGFGSIPSILLAA